MSNKSYLPDIISEWVKGISKQDPKYMTSLYSSNAVLLATYEPLLLGRKDIYEYFVDFLNKKNLKCKVTTCITQRGKVGIFVSSGLYTFTFRDEKGENKVVDARFTFVIKDNYIVTHHSSESPE
jgi:hypothetical protein